jgi:hypothetical protein
LSAQFIFLQVVEIELRLCRNFRCVTCTYINIKINKIVFDRIYTFSRLSLPHNYLNYCALACLSTSTAPGFVQDHPYLWVYYNFNEIKLLLMQFKPSRDSLCLILLESQSSSIFACLCCTQHHLRLSVPVCNYNFNEIKLLLMQFKPSRDSLCLILLESQSSNIFACLCCTQHHSRLSVPVRNYNYDEIKLLLMHFIISQDSFYLVLCQLECSSLFAYLHHTLHHLRPSVPVRTL